MALSDALREELQTTIAQNRVVLFMKGKRRLPQCGFSAQVVKILDDLVEEYATVNVLDNPEVREGIKVLSSWPTIPQLYVNGEFVGGCDIVTEMYQAGELHQTLGVEVPEVHPPRLTATPEALNALQEALAQNPGGLVRVEVDAAYRPALGIDEPSPSDFQVQAGSMKLLVDRMTATRADGLRIDFVPGESGGFRIENPNEPLKVRVMKPEELYMRRKNGERLEVIDVRTEDERRTASIEGTRLLTPELEAELKSLPKETPLVFHCHHGSRSMQAAERFVADGFWRVYNLDGGIDAWALQVDNSVPRY